MGQRDIKIIAIGDLHGSWDEDDESFFRESDVDLILWTGDLANDIHGQQEVARSLARLGSNSFGILGNHDGAFPLLAKCECVKARLTTWFLSLGHAQKVRRLRNILGKREIGFDGRDLHDLNISLIGLRPHSSGGHPISFAPTLRRVYRVTDAETRFQRLIQDARTDRLILLGHNGPAGVGRRRTSPFGADWRSDGGDGGDHDFAEAIALAQKLGKTVLFAVGGHMHNHKLKGATGDGSIRQPLGWLENVPVLNACWNPRIETEANGHRHYHYEILINADGSLQYAHHVAWCPGQSDQLRTVLYDSG